MKRIFLMRHSKAGQTAKHMLSDHERALTKKGEELCEQIAVYFNKFYKDTPPKLIIVSSATRAKQTAALLNKYFTQEDIKVITSQELYMVKSNEEIINVINDISDEYNSILIVGHNPGLQQFSLDFAMEGDKKKFREMRSNFAPGSFATFNADNKSWKNVSINSGVLLDFVNGKKVKNLI
jgi:phosphohistidine phosphatase